MWWKPVVATKLALKRSLSLSIDFLSNLALPAKERRKSEADVDRIFYRHVSRYMPIHLLSIDGQEADGVRFKLINRDDLKTQDYVTEEAIASRLAQHPEQAREDVIKALVEEGLKYAIFSHRWLQGDLEITFDKLDKADLTVLDAKAGPGYVKLKNFCAKALDHGCKLAWADTACIDKKSSAELEQAIRSMFNWYRRSAVCITYLAESSGIGDFKDEPWFTRGWTLQELLAPPVVKFYMKDWTPIKSIHDCPNDKDDKEILGAVSETTSIESDDLLHFSPGLLNVREKMVWASRRQTTLEEDAAYSLLGIFDISMPVTYGEGKRAFRRLMEAIVQDCREWQVFAWAGRHSPYAIAFPESPCGYGLEFHGHVAKAVLNPERPIHRPWDLGYPFYTMKKKGLEMRVLLVEMMLQIARGPGPEEQHHECLKFCPALQEQRYFHDMEAVCDTRFLHYSQWAIGIISYQTDGSGKHDEGELEANKDCVCILLGTGIYSPYGEWEKVGTTKVLTIRTKEVVRKKSELVWL